MSVDAFVRQRGKRTSDSILSVGSASLLLPESTATVTFCATLCILGGLAFVTVDTFARQPGKKSSEV